MSADPLQAYRIEPGPPSAEDFIRLRGDAGLTPPTREQAERGIDGAWFAVHAVHEPSGTTVGVGRVISDGGWYFHITDMAVDPAHQRRGLGDAILTALMDHIRTHAPPGGYVNLMADPPGMGLYERHGFERSTPTEGMRLWLR
jgi:GNAT superfamily N-acetyltransferase